MGEFELIDRYLKKHSNSPNIVVDNGDDCAVLNIPEGMQLAVSTDTMLAGRHFFEDAPADLIAQRAFGAALSDLAAMGAQPLAASLALSLPTANEAWIARFSDGLFSAAENWGCPIVGGDTVRGPLAITFHVKGLVPCGRYWRRSGAQVGDAVYVTGELGGAAAALALMKGKITVSAEQEAILKACYYQPSPRFDVVAELNSPSGLADPPLVHAAIDVSDGLIADLAHICRASGVGMQLDLSSIPISPHLRSFEQAMDWGLKGGDDYQLCFTAPAHVTKTLDKLCQNEDLGCQLEFNKIGMVCAEKGVFLDQKIFDLSSQSGFDHFL